MINEIWKDRFIAELFEKYPQKNKLVSALMELLSLEREATYRRLRKEVDFTTQEIITISSVWNISFDSIIGTSTGQVPFLMRPFNYITPSDDDLKVLLHVIQTINNFKGYPETELMDICNKLPRQLIAGYDYLNKFYLFKWKYEYTNGNKEVPFSQILISDEKRRLTAEFHQVIKTVPQTSFIFDRLLFDNLANEILYYHSIQMITNDEKELIKKDLVNLLDYLSDIANNGCYPDTKTKVNIYVSRLNLNTNYSYTHSNQLSVCFVHVFDKYEIYTFDKDMVANFRTYMQLKKKSSLQISDVDKIGCLDYFTKQHQIVDLL